TIASLVASAGKSARWGPYTPSSRTSTTGWRWWPTSAPARAPVWSTVRLRAPWCNTKHLLLLVAEKSKACSAIGGEAMPARTGEEYITGLRERAAEVHIGGEQVKDVTTHPAFRNGVRTVARLYDMQHDPAL